MNKIDVLKSAFHAQGLTETEKFQLSNLDFAKLILLDGDVVVENEHGSHFPVSDLSNDEMDLFWRALIERVVNANFPAEGNTSTSSQSDHEILYSFFQLKDPQGFDNGIIAVSGCTDEMVEYEYKEFCSECSYDDVEGFIVRLESIGAKAQRIFVEECHP